MRDPVRLPEANKVERYTHPPIVPELALLVPAYKFWLSTGTRILVEMGHSNRDNGRLQQRLRALLQPNIDQFSDASGSLGLCTCALVWTRQPLAGR
ncbi:hypothetical protein [Bythopirellula goksoeyrii]|uniref:Uncharacterized protein n=1 Tax=Bythopirellula goksoeyrii TaxID=1400387 RepID=A0A5B9Q4K0_9BACT|nr:hypothetical protein [Bythopirellula goksoeyrii]QEG33944.1 hypothetical protein Pr1d_12150 [Bythopirellula goksoeyrii]